jgi:2-keto-3-deoxy-6-phosphogluconate aldolase
MAPGSGYVRVGGMFIPSEIGAYLEAGTHLTKNFSAFLQGNATYNFNLHNYDYQALGGLEWKF